MRIKEMKFRTKLVAGLATGALVIGGAGAAFATWTTTTTGSGTASTGKAAAAYAVSADTTPSGMTPGGSGQALGGTVTDTGPYSETAPTSVTVSFGSPAITPDPANTEGASCTSAYYTLSNPVMTSHTGATGGPWDFTGASISATSTNPDGCQGATVNLVYTVNP